MPFNIPLGSLTVGVKLLTADFHRSVENARDDISAFSKSLKAHASEVQRLSNAMLTAGTGIGLGLGFAVKKAADFDQAMRNVNSIAHQSEGEFKALSASVQQLARDPTIREVPVNLAKGLYEVYSSGFKGAKALEIMRISAKGASAGMTDTATSSKALMAVLNSGIGGFENTSHAMDILFQEVNLGVNTFGDLAQHIGMVLPTAAAAGVSLQEVAAALALMTKNGLSTAESVTSLNNLLLHIIKPGKESGKIMHELGIENGIAALSAKGLNGVLLDVIQRTHDSKQAQVELMPEMRGMRGLLELATKSGTDWSSMLSEFTDKTKVLGQTQKALDEQNKGAHAQFQLLQKDVENLAIDLGGTLAPAVRDVINWIRSQVEWFSHLSDGTKKTAVEIAFFSAGLLLTVGIFGKVVVGINEMMIAMKTLGALSITTSLTVSGAIGNILTSLGAFARGATGVALGIGTLLYASEGTANAPGRFRDKRTKAYDLAEATKRMQSLKKERFEYLKLSAEERLEFVQNRFGTNAFGAPNRGRDEFIAELNANIEGLEASIPKMQKEVDEQNKAIALKAQALSLREKSAEFSDKMAKEKRIQEAKAKADKAQGERDAQAREAAAATKKIQREQQKQMQQRDEATEESRKRLFDLQHDNFEKAVHNAELEDAELRKKGVNQALRKKLLDAKISLAVQEESAANEPQRIQSELVDISDLTRRLEEGKQARIKAAKEAQDAVQASLAAEMLFQMAFQAEQNAAAMQAETDRQKAAEDRLQFDYRIGALDLLDYRNILAERLTHYKEYTREWMDLRLEVSGLDKQIEKEDEEIEKETYRRKFETLGNFLRGVQDVFKTAFSDLLEHGFKNFFQDILDGFKKLLVQMVAEWLAKMAIMGIVNLLTGGSGGLFDFLGGIFGFDDMNNDRKAQHWGADWLHHFATGARQAERMRSSALLPSGGSTTVYSVNIPVASQHFHYEADTQKVATELARLTAQELRGYRPVRA